MQHSNINQINKTSEHNWKGATLPLPPSYHFLNEPKKKKKKKKKLQWNYVIEVKIKSLPKICSWVIRRRVERNQVLRRIKKCDYICFIQVSFFTIVKYFIRFLIPTWHVYSLPSTDGKDCATRPICIQFYTYNNINK